MTDSDHPNANRPAIEYSATADALRSLKRRSAWLLAGGLVLGGVGLVLYTLAEDRADAYSSSAHGSQAVGLVGSVAAIFGLFGLVLVRRMRPILGRHPWRTVSYEKLLSPGAAAIIDAGHGPRPVRIETTRWTQARLFPSAAGEVWIAGDLAAGGVIASPGGAPIAWGRHKKPN